jgi:hypothetical protein
MRPRSVTVLANQPHCLLAAVHIGEHHVRTLAGEPHGTRPTHALGSTGNEDNPVGEPLHQSGNSISSRLVR